MVNQALLWLRPDARILIGPAITRWRQELQKLKISGGQYRPVLTCPDSSGRVKAKDAQEDRVRHSAGALVPLSRLYLRFRFILVFFVFVFLLADAEYFGGQRRTG